MLEGRKICFGYTREPVIKNVDVTFEKGKLYTIAGSNGSGKTTLIKILAGLIQSDGNLSLDGVSYSGYSKYDFAKKVAYLPQTRDIPSITVGQLVNHGRFPYLGFSRIMTPADKEAVQKALCMTNLENMVNKNLKNLSGGERQRAYIAMTLAQDTDYILMDEPTTYLDIGHKFDIMELCSKISKSGKSVIAVLHDLGLACRYSDMMMLLANGTIYNSGTPKMLIENGDMEKVFDVECSIWEKGVSKEYLFTPKR